MADWHCLQFSQNNGVRLQFKENDKKQNEKMKKLVIEYREFINACYLEIWFRLMYFLFNFRFFFFWEIFSMKILKLMSSIWIDIVVNEKRGVPSSVEIVW